MDEYSDVDLNLVHHTGASAGRWAGLTPGSSTVQYLELLSAPTSTFYRQMFKAAAGDAAHTSHNSNSSRALFLTDPFRSSPKYFGPSICFTLSFQTKLAQLHHTESGTRHSNPSRPKTNSTCVRRSLSCQRKLSVACFLPIPHGAGPASWPWPLFSGCRPQWTASEPPPTSFCKLEALLVSRERHNQLLVLSPLASVTLEHLVHTTSTARCTRTLVIRDEAATLLRCITRWSWFTKDLSSRTHKTRTIVTQLCVPPDNRLATSEESSLLQIWQVIHHFILRMKHRKLHLCVRGGRHSTYPKQSSLVFLQCSCSFHSSKHPTLQQIVFELSFCLPD